MAHAAPSRSDNILKQGYLKRSISSPDFLMSASKQLAINLKQVYSVSSNPITYLHKFLVSDFLYSTERTSMLKARVFPNYKNMIRIIHFALSLLLTHVVYTKTNIIMCDRQWFT